MKLAIRGRDFGRTGMIRKLINVETHAGEPISAGTVTLVPIAKSLRLMIPGVPAGLIWNRPVAMVIRDTAGSEQVIPIRDSTRRAVLALWGAAIGSAIYTMLFILKRQFESKNKEEVQK
jgi:hypothetical protein